MPCLTGDSGKYKHAVFHTKQRRVCRQQTKLKQYLVFLLSRLYGGFEIEFIVRPWKYSEESTMSNEQVAPETKGVTVKLLATVDLGPEIEGMAGRQLRMRRVTIEPGGVFGPIHDHKDRPGTVYILQGTITDHRNGVATDYGPGVGWPEDRNTTHWLENRGTIPAVEISVDIVRQE